MLRPAAILVEKLPEVVGGDAIRKQDYFRIRVHLEDLSRGDHDLRYADFAGARAYPVEVREVKAVEVRQLQCAGTAFERKRQGDGVPN